MTDVDGNVIRARATIHLPGGLVPGRVYDVDPTSPYVADCLAAGYLVEEAAEAAAGEAPDEPE